MGREKITGGQAHELLGWANRLTDEEYQERRWFFERVTDPTQDLSALFRSYFRETGECRIAIPALPRLSLAELKAKFSWIEKIHCDISPEGPVTLTLGTVLAEGEPSVSGVEYERRLVSVGGSLGPQHALWLILHQDEHPAFKALLGKVYVDFPGLIAVYGGGDRRVAYLFQHGGHWAFDWRWVGRDLDSHGRIAVGRPAEVG